ncbi:MAG: outer membrane protein assembly factor BamA, partial [Candidatus Aminicenantia bacterium]
CLLISVFCLLGVSYPQDFQNKHVGTIKIKTNGQENGEEIRKLISIKQGEKFSLKKINESIKFIFKTGLFSDIEVRAVETEKVDLIFLVTKRLFINEIEFSGVKADILKKLRGELFSLRPGDAFSLVRVEKVKQELKEILRKNGFFSSQINYSFQKDIKKSKVKLIYHIKPGKRLIIKKIEFEGKTTIPKNILKNQLKTKEGKFYIPTQLINNLEELKKIYRQKGYYQFQIELQKEEIDPERKEINLKIEINDGEKINFIIQGAKIPLSLITPLWEERVFKEWALSEGKAKILSYLRKKGYIFATINSFLKRTENELEVIYQVHPGKKYQLDEIIYYGTSYFSPSQLKEKLDLTNGLPLVNPWIDGNKLFNLPKELELLYQSQGFPDVKVTMNFEREKNKLKVLVYITEGIQNIISPLEISGKKSFSQKRLLGQIKSFPGGPYYQPQIQNDIERLELFYLNQGFRGTKIRAEVNQESKPNISVKFIIQEGARVIVEKIIVIGNIVTRKNIILRELRIKEGDYAYQNKILETKRRLEALGIFTEVQIEEISLSNDSENLIIKVREGERTYIGLGIGLKTKREPYAFAAWNFELMPRLTFELIRNNIWGTGSTLSFVTQIGSQEKRGVISWEQPYFFGLPIHPFISAWTESEDRKSFDYDKRGVSLTSIKKIGTNFILLSRLRWTRTTLFNLEIAESEVDRQHRPFSTSSFLSSFIWDKRDDPFNPKRGSFLSFSSEWAYPIFEAESNYFKNFIQFQNYFPLSSQLTFSSTTRLGLAWGSIPISERFFGGGSNSYRGEKFDELGPKDLNSLKPIGGKALILFNFELKFPLFSSFRNLSGAIFYDKGNLFSEPNELRINSLRDALGLGLRYKTPLGPIRIDFGMDIRPPDGKKKILTFITIGNVL